LIIYNDGIKKQTDFTQDYNQLKNEIDKISASGGTNIGFALEKAKSKFQSSGTLGRSVLPVIVLMSDGLPEHGSTYTRNDARYTYAAYGNYAGYASAVYNTAVPLKYAKSGYDIYTLGFFHSLNGKNLVLGEKLMSDIHNKGYYPVTDPDKLEFAFGDIGKNITGSDPENANRIVIRIACPVDASISLNGETLTSSSANLKTAASFGTLELQGANKDVKVFTLNKPDQYIVSLNGTGTGTMDYTISFYNSNKQEDLRRFENVPISNKTLIKTNTIVAQATQLSVDKNGDGIEDERWSASANALGQIVVVAGQNVSPYTPPPENLKDPIEEESPDAIGAELAKKEAAKKKTANAASGKNAKKKSSNGIGIDDETDMEGTATIKRKIAVIVSVIITLLLLCAGALSAYLVHIHNRDDNVLKQSAVAARHRPPGGTIGPGIKKKTRIK
jgi:hypothetical protein